MNKSLYYSLNRARELDAGGAADLQTDIMRFMAILALCLVAIFALVQSIPLNPVVPVQPTESPTEPDKVAPAPAPPVPKPSPDAEVVEKMTPEPTWRDLVRAASPVATSGEAPTATPKEPETDIPDPVREQRPTPAPEPELQEPMDVSPQTPSAAEPTELEQPTDDTTADEGFTLRFESDAALTRLVARNEVGLYAISSDRALRMSVNRGSVAFWPASAPNQYHEMDPGTVPAAVVAALGRAGSVASDPNMRWGVTLPTPMQRQLGNYLNEHSSGALVIEASGNLRLEP